MVRIQKYRVVYECDRCGDVNTTKAKSTKSAPARCNNCGSSYTRKIKAKPAR